MRDTEPRRTGGFPLAPVATGVLGLLVVVGAAYGGTLRFGAPRFDLGVEARTPPAVTETPSSAPSQTPSASPPPTQKAAHALDLTVPLIVLGAVVVLVVAFFVVRWWRGRTRDGAEGVVAPLDDVALDDRVTAQPDVETSRPVVRRGLRRALLVLDEGREPTDAIVQAWLGLQETAEDAGFSRLDSETPTEFTARILTLAHVDRGALDILRRLYLAARFGDAVATHDDVAHARDALRRLADGWELDRDTAPTGTTQPDPAQPDPAQPNPALHDATQPRPTRTTSGPR